MVSVIEASWFVLSYCKLFAHHDVPSHDPNDDSLRMDLYMSCGYSLGEKDMGINVTIAYPHASTLKASRDPIYSEICRMYDIELMAIGMDVHGALRGKRNTFFHLLANFAAHRRGSASRFGLHTMLSCLQGYLTPFPKPLVQFWTENHPQIEEHPSCNT